jgi:hypothetical protein
MSVKLRWGPTADMCAGIDPTVLRLGDDDEFESRPFDHSFDDVDARSVLRATSAAVFSRRDAVMTLARKVIDAEPRPSRP